ncbi:hypothetical protein NBRC116595_38160 [Aliiglaciecola sp. NS0011-25]
MSQISRKFIYYNKQSTVHAKIQNYLNQLKIKKLIIIFDIRSVSIFHSEQFMFTLKNNMLLIP